MYALAIDAGTLLGDGGTVHSSTCRLGTLVDTIAVPYWQSGPMEPIRRLATAASSAFTLPRKSLLSVLYVHISAGFGVLGDLAIQLANFMRLLARSARICCTPRCQLARGRFHSEATFNSEPFGSGVLDRPDGVRYSFGGWQGAHRDWPSAGRRKPPREAARRQGHLAIWSRL